MATTVDGAAVSVVRGHVRWSDGRPFAGAMVRAADRDLRAEQPLGQTLTDASGQYEIRYVPAQFSRAEAARADLIVRVSNAAGATIASSPVVFNAPSTAVVDLVVSATAPGLLSEFERIVAELAPLLVNVTVAGTAAPTIVDQLASLTADDLAFLVAETGLARRLLTTLTAAATLETQAVRRRASLPAALFYGLLREGLPSTLAAFGLVSRPQAAAALDRAFAANVIPAALRASATNDLALLQSIAVGETLQSPSAARPFSPAQVLQAVLPSTADQTAFLTAYANRDDGPIDAFWTSLRSQPAFAAKVDALQQIVQLAAITGNHLPLLQELQGRKLGSVRDLIALDAAAWTAIVAKPGIGVPPDAVGDTPAAQAATYVAAIIGRLQAAFPTAAVAQVFSRGPIASLDGRTRAAVMQFFANAPDFDVRATRVDPYVHAHAATVFAGIAETDQPAVIRHVKRAQRLFQVSTNASTLAALLDTPLDSAHAIARMPRSSFIAQYAAGVGGEDAATELHTRATAITTRSLQLYALMNDAINGVQPRSVAGDL
jgi:hypothetical protein